MRIGRRRFRTLNSKGSKAHLYFLISQTVPLRAPETPNLLVMSLTCFYAARGPRAAPRYSVRIAHSGSVGACYLHYGRQGDIQASMDIGAIER